MKLVSTSQFSIKPEPKRLGKAISLCVGFKWHNSYNNQEDRLEEKGT